MKALKWNYGFTTKTVHGKEYVYFWKCTGTGRKTEEYIGPAGKVKTQRHAFQTEIAYLEGLGQELNQKTLEIKQKLEELPADEVEKEKKRSRHGYSEEKV